MKVLAAIAFLIALGAGAYWYAFGGSPMRPGEVRVGSATSTVAAPELASSSVQRDGKVTGYAIEEVARGLEVPWSIAFTSPSRMLVSERPGRIRVIENGELRAEPLHTFADVASRSESGLLSLAVHPQYASNRFVYAVYTYQSGGGAFNKVVRFRDEGDSVSDITAILDGIPAANIHVGSRLAFGPDGKLYITTGDASERPNAQELGSLSGKILRLNDDGSIPADNPFVGRSGARGEIWSYGHRNPQGLSWDAMGNLYETEHGPSGFDGAGGGDEVNRIQKGGNYGWPLVSHDETREGTIAPLVTFTPAEAPSAVLVYSGKSLPPQFAGNLFFGALRGEGLMRVVLDGGGRVASSEKMADVQYGRIREVVEGPDGVIYFTTSNRDGRGSPAAADDRIFRIIPKL